MSSSAISGITGARWSKSSFSGGNEGQCVEFARTGNGTVPVRDSKSPHLTPLAFPAPSWSAFTSALRADSMPGPE